MSTSLKKILVVDDEGMMRKIIRRILEKSFDVEVVEAANPRQGFSILEHQDLPDLILLDMLMPMMNGLTMLKYIRNQENTKDVPVIIVTALAEPDLVKALMELGIVDYIKKPIDADILTEKVGNFFNMQRLKAADAQSY